MNFLLNFYNLFSFNVDGNLTGGELKNILIKPELLFENEFKDSIRQKDEIYFLLLNTDEFFFDEYISFIYSIILFYRACENNKDFNLKFTNIRNLNKFRIDDLLINEFLHLCFETKDKNDFNLEIENYDMQNII